MRVAVAGLAQRQPGQPVVILEAGAGETGIETWIPVFDGIAQLAPVLAYDRRGIGQSEPDVSVPTLTRVAESLHHLLQQMRIPPPYILVGQSWGGVFVRAFSARYPSEVAGLVFVDVTDFESTREEKAAVLPAEERQRALEPPALPTIPSDTPTGLRAEYEQIGSEMQDDYPQARALGRLPLVPIAVVVATPPGRLAGNGGAMVRLQIKRQAEWALQAPNGLFVTTAHVGHHVHRDDPVLVLRLIEHVLRYSTQGQ
jgi:pimeloyl-ACP methyl ester carboxylesterase